MAGIYKYALSSAIALGLLCAGGVLARRNFTDSAAAGAKKSASPSPGGATFSVDEGDLHKPATLIAYGDMRFTDPANREATNPDARQALVARIAQEKPDAILMNGDVPWHGGEKGDYAVYQTETAAWRAGHLRVYPALGNHEFSRCEVAQCLENWWSAFPELRDRRWYSVGLGRQLYAIALDSDTSLLPGSDQRQWLEAQISSLPASVRFVLITMHHPPVADIQKNFNVDHNPRPNEISLADYLKTAAATSRAKFLVSAGHIHNYERAVQDDVVYLVAGGGGAHPYPVERTPSDLYQDTGFPNFHYVKFVLEGDTLKGTMYRLDLDAATPAWQEKDTFQVRAK
jgi:calcineurin-like phosphoesterase family protein